MVELKSKQTVLNTKEGNGRAESEGQRTIDSVQEVSLQEEIEAIFEEFDDLFKELADR